MDVLLVLGSVTSEQYLPLRMAMMRQGLMTKVVRLDEGECYASDESLMEICLSKLIAEGIYKRPMGVAGRARQLHFATVDLEDKIIREAFDDLLLSDVKAVVYPASNLCRAPWEWLTSRLDNLQASYSVQLFEPYGSHRLVGHGYGPSLP